MKRRLTAKEGTDRNWGKKDPDTPFKEKNSITGGVGRRKGRDREERRKEKIPKKRGIERTGDAAPGGKKGSTKTGVLAGGSDLPPFQSAS